VVVVTEGSGPPRLAFIAPYAVTSIAEYFMGQRRDVLIVYDNLTHHVRAYGNDRSSSPARAAGLPWSYLLHLLPTAGAGNLPARRARWQHANRAANVETETPNSSA
jgi:hypothetical protein